MARIWERLQASRAALFALVLLAAVATRWPAYGEWNYAIDDQYFALVGQRLLAGDLLYVDIWDRKPPLLYLSYAAIAAVSPSVLAYQLVATLFAALGAYGTARIARLIAPLPASVMAGVGYLVLMTRFGGGNGEAAVFYNPLILFAAWSIASRIAQLRRGELPRRVLLGMFSAGLAIGYKQSALFEAVFLGLAVLALLARGGTPSTRLAGRALILGAIGAVPMLAIALTYWSIGHFAELWQALVQSNLARAYEGPSGRVGRAITLTVMLALPLLFAILGYLRARANRADDSPLDFLACWAIAAILGIAAFPSLYLHYVLPLLAPLMVLSAPLFARPRLRPLAFAAMVLLSLGESDMFDLADRARARPAAAALADHVRAVTLHKRLLVFGMPTYLYALIGQKPPSVLAFPAHMYEWAEAGATGRDEVAELRRVLHDRPETVVVQEPIPVSPRNEPNVAQVAAYVRNCGAVRRFTIYDHGGAQRMAVYSGCPGARR